MTTIWSTTVSHIGPDAADMLEAGVVILFGEPVPPALADVSVVHTGAEAPARDIAPGDMIVLGAQRLTVDAVGDLAGQNLRELGHVVIYVGQPEQELLPGAILASGDMPTAPAVGASITVEGA